MADLSIHWAQMLHLWFENEASQILHIQSKA